MSESLSIVFLWHMHQPWYLDPAAGVLTLPWVRLHAAKDYVDMVALLEEFPSIHQTFNVTPCLLEQLAWYEAGHQDAWEALAARPTDSLSPAEAEGLTRQCLFAHPQRMIAAHPRYDELAARVQRLTSAETAPRAQPLATQELRDLTVWFHLVWLDPRWRREDPAIAALVAQGRAFTEADKAVVLAAHRRCVGAVVPTYRAAQHRGQIEVSTSPWTHPILPLLHDAAVAPEATPHLPMPSKSFAYPDDVAMHLRLAVERYQSCFGRPPRGLWPSEGSVSAAILPAVASAGFTWLATDEAILWKSLGGTPARSALYQPYRLNQDKPLAGIFRDRTLSDLIGFTYAGRPAAESADDFLQRLHRIRQEATGPAPLVAVILDGENAWEHYPNDGEEFLRRLYERLSREAATLRCVTISEYLAAHPPEAVLDPLAPGSWIRGDFTTWIGDAQKNRAWDLLADARAALAHAEQHPRAADAQRHLLIAEGSDWFWWFGPEHTSAQDAEFDRLFRQHLIQVYTLLELPVPPAVRDPLVQHVAGGVIPPTRWMTPTIDGVVTDYFEWLHAGRIECAQARGAMAPGQDRIHRFWWGCDRALWHVRLDLAHWPPTERLTVAWVAEQPAFKVEIVLAEQEVRATWSVRDARGTWGPGHPVEHLASHMFVEFSMPLADVGLRHGTAMVGQLQVWQDGALVEMIPSTGTLTLALPEETDAHALWSA